MGAHGNLADPSYEPSDEELAERMRGAFAGVREAQEQSMSAMRERIRRLQAEARLSLESDRRARSRS